MSAVEYHMVQHDDSGESYEIRTRSSRPLRLVLAPARHTRVLGFLFLGGSLPGPCMHVLSSQFLRRLARFRFKRRCAQSSRYGSIASVTFCVFSAEACATPHAILSGSGRARWCSRFSSACLALLASVSCMVCAACASTWVQHSMLSAACAY